ncbi:MAG: hypothetical protein CM15mP117_04720 [Alphaproteobacteria bacterium]|nr:MAG: hypothetical protein CM15mP117_04720 [Alphaproteobacteria bacterium]
MLGLQLLSKRGKNREIRRVMEFLGYSVSRLIRTSYGPFQLGAMKEDDLQEVKQTILREQLGQSNTNFPKQASFEIRGKTKQNKTNTYIFSKKSGNNNANNRRNKARRKAR